MTNPLRKQRLGRGSPLALAASTDEPDDWVIRSFHPTKPGFVDLAPLAVSVGGGEEANGGGATARPALLKALVRQCRNQYSMATFNTLAIIKSSIQNWWNFLDTLEGQLSVTELSDISDLHGVLWLRSGVNRTPYGNVRLLLQNARMAANLPTLHWPPRPRVKGTAKDPPDPKWIRLIYRELKDCVRSMLMRWSRSDQLAKIGNVRDAKSSYTRWQVHDMHSTFRAALAALDEPIAKPAEIRRAMGMSSERDGLPRSWGMQHGDMLATLYPTKLDVLACFHLVLLKTGWNPQVALDVDISDLHWATPHPTSSDIVVLRSRKERGGEWQHAVCSKRHSFAPYKIIETLIERTRPLRIWCQRELERAKVELTKDKDNELLRAEVARLERSIRSPWLHIDGHKTDVVRMLDDRSYSSQSQQPYLPGLIQKIGTELMSKAGSTRPGNRAEESELPTLPIITATDLRDAFIDFAYVASGYSWFVAKIAAGHTTLSSLRSYLLRQRYRRHSEVQVRRLQDALLSEIENKRVVDPTILKALLEKGHVTQEQRDLWEDHKALTRMDMGCLDPLNPPEDIAPQHQKGTVCGIQRCILCPKGIVLRESVDGLARRQAELEHIRSVTPIFTWIEGNYPDELERLEATLAQFDSTDVQLRVATWHSKIAQGTHVVVDLEGGNV